MSSEVSRHFATLGRRQIHYRRAGGGPPVLLLHQTPTSSAELLPLMRRLAARFTVVAPDMPGYGASDRLAQPRLDSATRDTIASAAPEPPLTMAALVESLAEFMTVLNIPTAGIYGFHTGASLATAFASRHPKRTAVSIAEGLLCLYPRERDELLARYLEPFTARWDGGHLAWLWTRLKDQSVFFPWYERTAQARLGIDAASSALLAAKAEDWLRSGAHYHEAYRAAMSYDPRPDIACTTTQHYVFSQPGDPLAAHLERLRPLPPNVRVETLIGSEAAMLRITELLTAHCADLPAPPVVPTRAIEAGVWQEYVGQPGAQLRVLRAGASQARPIVVQHGAQSSAAACLPLIAGLAPMRSVYAVELPGHGVSDFAPTAAQTSIEQLASILGDVLLDYGVGASDFLGLGAGAAILIELQRATRRLASPASSLTLISPIDLSADAPLGQAVADSYVHAPIDSHGGYLLKAWHEVRDHQLFFPWYERRRAFGIDSTPQLAPQWLQARTVEHLTAGARGVELRRREAQYRLLDRLRFRGATPVWAAPVACPRFSHTQALAHSAATFLALQGPMSDWVRPILASVDRLSVIR